MAATRVLTWHPSKAGYKDLLLRRAAELPDCRQRQSDWDRLNCLAEVASAVLGRRVYPSTLRDALAREGLPDWSTLDALEAGAGLPLLEQLVALGRTTLAEMAEALDREMPTTQFTPPERRLVEASRWWGPEVTQHMLAAAEVLQRRVSSCGGGAEHDA
jgi:hypothetical protein